MDTHATGSFSNTSAFCLGLSGALVGLWTLLEVPAAAPWASVGAASIGVAACIVWARHARFSIIRAIALALLGVAAAAIIGLMCLLALEIVGAVARGLFAADG